VAEQAAQAVRERQGGGPGARGDRSRFRRSVQDGIAYNLASSESDVGVLAIVGAWGGGLWGFLGVGFLFVAWYAFLRRAPHVHVT
jgi:hypothetical protein